MAVEVEKIEDDDPGAPEWMVTFSDCMTLLLTFFVLLLSFAAFEEGQFQYLQKSIGEGIPSIQLDSGELKEGMYERQTIRPVEDVKDGSRIPMETKDAKGNIARTKRLTEFKDQKVFSINSSELFYAQGMVISSDGRKVLDLMIEFLKAVPCRIVISENNPNSKTSTDAIGVQRSWAVADYISKKGINEDSFSVTGSSMIGRGDGLEGRQLIFTLLDRSVYE